MPQLVNLHRAPRHARFENISHGTLGNYERTVRCVVFSHNSKILASGDISGCIDTWTLEQAAGEGLKSKNRSSESDDESDSDDEDDSPILEGERWRAIAADSPIPRLKSSVALLSFRPPTTSPSLLTDGTTEEESRLMALTTEHQLVELDALEGKLSEWSRRNPKAFLPMDFKGVKDRAMGCLWDLSDPSRERLWLYGTSWLWMFDLKHDFPSTEELDAAATAESKAAETANSQALTKKQKQSSSQKRKREEAAEEAAVTGKKNKKHNTGAGDKMPLSETNVFSDTKARAFVGPDATQGEWVPLEKERERATDDEEEEEEEDNDARLARLRRENNSAANGTSTKVTGTDKQVAKSSAPARRWWYTYKYRGILGIVPLSATDAETESEEDRDSNPNTGLEVAVIERPMWDVDLPDRYVREYE